MKNAKCSGVFIASVVLIFGVASSLQASEKGGLLVEVSKKTAASNDKVTINGVGNMSIDKDMTLRLQVTNSSNREMAAAPVESTVLVQRWGIGESERIERNQGKSTLEALHPFQKTILEVGKFHIGGHMHGSSDRHVDHVVGWKVVIMRDTEKLEFTSGTSYDALEKRARPAGPNQ